MCPFIFFGNNGGGGGFWYWRCRYITNTHLTTNTTKNQPSTIPKISVTFSGDDLDSDGGNEPEAESISDDDPDSPLLLQDFVPGEAEKIQYDKDEEVYEDFSRSPKESEGAKALQIIGHRFAEGRPLFKVEWDTVSNSWEELRDLKQDYPRLVASYIVTENVSRSKRRESDHNLKWAKHTLQNLDRAARRIAKL